MYTLAQVSDLHLDDAKAGARGIDTRANFARVLEDLRGHRVDGLVLTGDLAEPSAYGWFRAKVAEAGLPSTFVFGNHDRRELFEESGGGARLYFAREIAGRPALFLDSGDGMIDAAQLSWLRDRLQAGTGPLLVIVHHPILDCGTLFMDRRYPLRNRDEVRLLLKEAGRSVDILCGHYHLEAETSAGRIRQLAAPSTYYQIRPDQETLGIDPLPIGYRLVEIDGGIRSRVVRLPAAGA